MASRAPASQNSTLRPPTPPHDSRRRLTARRNHDEGGLAKTIHTMLRVLDEARSVAFYDEAFGLKVADRYDFDSFTLVYLSNPESEHEVELTINKGETTPYDLGNGYGHVAVSVGDLDAEHERMRAAGLAPKDIKEISHQGTKLGRFFFIEDPDGYKIEVLERGGRFK